MTTLELQKKLLAYYEAHLAKADSVSNVYSYLEDVYLNNGICYLLEHVFENQCEDDMWIRKTTRANGRLLFWCEPPSPYESNEVNLSRLQSRITILRSLISSTNAQ